MHRQLLTLAEVEEWLQISRDSIRRLIGSGELEAVCITSKSDKRNTYRIKPEVVEDFLRRNSTKQPPKPRRNPRDNDGGDDIEQFI